MLASSLFFVVTPFHYSTNELRSFTEGTIFDVMLAFVGGIAGFIGIIRKEAVKVIAGVAVATACIPPRKSAGLWEKGHLRNEAVLVMRKEGLAHR